VREQREPVRRVEGDEIRRAPAPGEQRAHAAVCEQLLDEVLAQPRVAQTTILFDGEQRQRVDERACEQAAAVAIRGAALARGQDPHALHTATRGVLLEHVTREVELGDAVRRVCAHLRGVVRSRSRFAQRDAVARAHQPHRGARDTEADLHLRADGTHSTWGPSKPVRKASCLWPPS
jgi:hypothetical protein